MLKLSRRPPPPGGDFRNREISGRNPASAHPFLDSRSRFVLSTSFSYSEGIVPWSVRHRLRHVFALRIPDFVRTT